jgi:hypothetical protein
MWVDVHVLFVLTRNECQSCFCRFCFRVDYLFLITEQTTGNKFAGFDQYLRISTMCQTLDGTYYVGTGCTFDNWDGDGIFTSTDGINWTLVPGSDDFSRVNELQADPIVTNKVWICRFEFSVRRF